MKAQGVPAALAWQATASLCCRSPGLVVSTTISWYPVLLLGVHFVLHMTLAAGLVFLLVPLSALSAAIPLPAAVLVSLCVYVDCRCFGFLGHLHLEALSQHFLGISWRFSWW